MNALFVTRGGPPVLWAAGVPHSRVEAYLRAMEMSNRLGGLAMLNHPNFHYAASADLVFELTKRGLRLMEIANEAVDSANEGDHRHPSTEQIWDDVLSRGATVWGVASDDAHHYYDAEKVRAEGAVAHVGNRGFVMVRAEKNPTSIRAAIEQGDFYSSNGVLLDRLELRGGDLIVQVSSRSAGQHHIRFIGLKGKVLREVQGRSASFSLAEAPAGYVRVVVENEAGKKAWGQPVRTPLQ